MYNTNIKVEYNDNMSYRECLRKVTNMNIEKLNIPWDQMDDDLDEETKDELLFDQDAMNGSMDYIYEKTKSNNKFIQLYLLAAAKMFSENHDIGLAVLFSYSYFTDFHLCLVNFFNNIESPHLENLKNKLS